jgi:hypothetical protein
MTSAAPYPTQHDASAGSPLPASGKPEACPRASPAPFDGIPRESGLVRLARPPAPFRNGTTVGPQVAARTGLSHSRSSAASCPTGPDALSSSRIERDLAAGVA